MFICPVSYQLTPFAEDVIKVLGILGPPALCMVIWTVFVTNRTAPRRDVLGLNDSSITYSEVPGHRISGLILLLYGFSSFVTFSLGLLAHDSYRYLQELLR